MLDTSGADEGAASGTAPSESEAAERTLQLQLTYIDALPYVNLVLLRSVLSRVRGYILDAHAVEGAVTRVVEQGVEGKADEVQQEEQEEEQGEGQGAEEGSPHLQLCRRTFKALNGMDDTARQEGVRWWLECREEFGV
jgi:hypothetical protein